MLVHATHKERASYLRSKPGAERAQCEGEMLALLPPQERDRYLGDLSEDERATAEAAMEGPLLAEMRPESRNKMLLAMSAKERVLAETFMLVQMPAFERNLYLDTLSQQERQHAIAGMLTQATASTQMTYSRCDCGLDCDINSTNRQMRPSERVAYLEAHAEDSENAREEMEVGQTPP